MSLIGDLTDVITGGANKNAERHLADVMAQIQGIHTPTADELRMTPLAQYVDTGELTPALMEAAQTDPSAFLNEKLSSVPMETMQQVLARENEIASSNGMTPQEQAAIARAEAEVNRNTAGQRGAIAQDFAGRGIPQSLISAALQNATVGQEASQANQSALQARADAATRGEQANANAGNLAGNMYGLESNQANTVAAAEDALAKFNTANTQQARALNQANTQASKVYNTTNRQNISNENVTGEHQVQVQNQVNAPTTAAQLALQKGQELSGMGQAQANQQTDVGKQNAGTFGAIVGGASQLGSKMIPAAGSVPASVPPPQDNGNTIRVAEGGEIPWPVVPATNFEGGGPVHGMAVAPGNDSRNDTVPARLSPGEFVVPRTAMADPAVRNFLAKNVPTPRPPAAHPSDIASVMRALAELRGGA